MPSTLEVRFRTFASRPPVRRIGLVLMAVVAVKNLVLLSIALLDQPSRKTNLVLSFAWVLGLVVLLFLAREWRRVSRRERESRAAASN